MKRQMLHGKIHRATVTDAQLDYEGSITIDPVLLEAADILSHEKVLIANLTNGARIESYCIPGEPESGVVCLNGGAAKHGKKGDLIIIMAFAVLNDEELKTHVPRVVRVDSQNRMISAAKAVSSKF
ncbi:MAG: aspartate 1-decarboxylase [Candidatus Omnitrophota bacterium]|nr:aspartate 1-decarboxylase [Candidatus Omnitrophota bacterium]